MDSFKKARSRFQDRKNIDKHHRLGKNELGIALPALISILPAMILGSGVLWIVYRYKVENPTVTDHYFSNVKKVDDSGHYFVQYDSSRLVTLSSLASTIATLLPGAIMTLFWRPMALSYQKASDSRSIEKLPTPYHLNLLLAMKTGGIQPLWDWIAHSARKMRERQSSALKSTGLLLTLSTFLGTLVLATDTWFHVTTKSVAFDQIALARTPSQTYGRSLPAYCGSDGKDCTSISAGSKAPDLINRLEVYQVLGNQSTINRVAQTNITGQRLSYLAPANPAVGLDYRSTTLASQSNCSLVTSNCATVIRDPADLTGDDFNCTSGFNASNTNTVNVTANNDEILYGFLVNRNGTGGLFDDLSSHDIASNPFSTFFQVTLNSPAPDTGAFDGGQIAVNASFGLVYYYLTCSTLLSNFTYIMTNGTLTDGQATPLDNRVLIYNIMQPNTFGDCGAQLISSSLISLLQSTAAAVTDSFAQAYDTTFLAPILSASEAVLNIAEQQRIPLLVTRVQKSALFAFLAALAACLLLGLSMTILAIRSANKKSMEVQARLSLLGIISSRFEPASASGARVQHPAELFEENKTGARTASRIGIFRNDEGGWVLEKLAPKASAENRFADDDDDDVPLVGLENDGQRADPTEDKRTRRAHSADARSFLTLRSEASHRRSDDYAQTPQVEEEINRWQEE